MQRTSMLRDGDSKSEPRNRWDSNTNDTISVLIANRCFNRKDTKAGVSNLTT